MVMSNLYNISILSILIVSRSHYKYKCIQMFYFKLTFLEVIMILDLVIYQDLNFYILAWLIISIFIVIIFVILLTFIIKSLLIRSLSFLWKKLNFVASLSTWKPLLNIFFKLSSRLFCFSTLFSGEFYGFFIISSRLSSFELIFILLNRLFSRLLLKIFNLSLLVFSLRMSSFIHLKWPIFCMLS